MIDLEADLQQVFFTEDFAVPVTLRRFGEPDVSFFGIVSSVTQDLLDGHVSSATTRLRYPAAAAELLEGHELAIGAATYRVLRVERVVDGLEADALLAPLEA